MNTNQSATMYESVPVVSELNKVQGFDPLKFLRRTTKGEKVLDLKYKKLWFRLKYPNGRIKLSSLKITDQLAIIEARVYFDKNDAQPRSSFIAQREAKATPGGLYIESAQHAAIDQALSDAGFGVQFSAAAPTANAEKAAETVKEQPTVAETATAEQVSTEVPVTVAEAATEVINEPMQEAPVVQETVAEATDFDESVIRIVQEQAQQFINDLFGKLRERLIDLRSGKAVFVGGGSILLKKQIEASGKVGAPIFVDEISANKRSKNRLRLPPLA